ncbi:MAG: class I SAM-dependent methyltransferase family protein [Candidatus Bathyarchaeota archaeon]|nr:class I SAM-dependent methyltransferase family protein [Candidatus Bathyarchaeota archaeon]
MRIRLQERANRTLGQGAPSKIYNSYDVVGNIAIIKVPNNNREAADKAARAIMNLYRNVKSVFLQTSQVGGDFRIRKLECLAGDGCTVTVHREAGCIFKVDVEKCYFSPRLQFERGRIAGLVGNGEVVVNMFAGAGCFSIEIAKVQPSVKVYSIDVNPIAFEFMQENVKLNRVSGRVISLLGDAKEAVIGLQGVADRVLMPLPELALEYLPYAVKTLKPSGGWIHFHDFEHAENRNEAIEKTKQKISDVLEGLDYSVSYARIIRSTGPNWYQTVLDIHLSGRKAKF